MSLNFEKVYTSQVIHGPYRPHIDGIRALAVLPVVLFHLSPHLLPGGFVGVDIFFVISGFLITGGILRELQKGHFSYASFYHRRIKRILPAYFTLIFAVLLTGGIIYNYTQLRDLADTSVAGTLFSANLYFFSQVGDYFSPENHNNALLHLWSLAVEEQFYIVIPVACMLAWRISRGIVKPMLFLMTLLSFGASVYAISKGHGAAAFYLLPYRAWEILAGSLLACAPVPAAEQGRGQSFAAVLGLFLTFFSYIFYHPHMPFPGISALIPVAGTALLVRYGESLWTKEMLSFRPLVFIGKISYSLYLWHWPVIIFWSYLLLGRTGAWDKAGMLALSFLLAAVSWRFVEMPMRISGVLDLRNSFRFAAAGIFLLAGIGTVCALGRGWPTLLHLEANRLVHAVNMRPGFLETRIKRYANRGGLLPPPGPEITDYAYGINGTFLIGAARPPTFLLIGDSHAGSLRFGLDYLLRHTSIGGISYSVGGKDVFRPGSEEVAEVNRILSRYQGINKVILSEYWISPRHKFEDPRSLDIFFAQLSEFALLLKQRNIKLYLVSDYPVYDYNVSNMPSLKALLGLEESVLDLGKQTPDEYAAQHRQIDPLLRMISAGTGAEIVPVQLAFAGKDTRFESLDQTTDHAPVLLYRNGSHLTPEGSIKAARFLIPRVFSTMLAAQLPQPSESYPPWSTWWTGLSPRPLDERRQ